MQRQPAHSARQANTLLLQTLKPFFGRSLAWWPQLGRRLYAAIEARLRAEGLADATHAEEVFARVLSRAQAHLGRHGASAVRELDRWLDALRRQETRDYLIELVEQDGLSLRRTEPVGRDDASTPPLLHDERVGQLVREAMRSLRPRHRELLRLDLAGADPGEIRRRMGLVGERSWRKLKHEANQAMKTAVLSLWDSSAGARQAPPASRDEPPVAV